MLTISPINQYNKFDVKKLALNNNLSSEDCTSQITHACPIYPTFCGYTPDLGNTLIINQIANIIKSEAVKKIAIAAHSFPDGDAIGSMLALKRMIEKSTGKKPDAFILYPLPHNIKFIDPNNEINVIKDLFPNQEGGNTREVAKELLRNFGKYDLVLAVDTSNISLFDKEIQLGILEPSKRVIKIDHHPAPKGDDKEFNYGNINFVDSKKESAAQVIMQFAKPLGLKIDDIGNNISDPLSLGIITDSVQFKAARGQEIFADVSTLSKTSRINSIIEKSSQFLPEEFTAFRKIISEKIQFSDDGEIAFFIIKKNELKAATKNVIIETLRELSVNSKIKYYFSVTEHVDVTSPFYTASVRSKDKPIIQEIRELGGGGHDYACGIKTTNYESAEAFALQILQTLQQIKNSQ